MSNVTENLYLEQEKLNTFTGTDITIIALFPPVSPWLAWPPTRRSGGAEKDADDDASYPEEGPGHRTRGFLAPARKRHPTILGPP